MCIVINIGFMQIDSDFLCDNEVLIRLSGLLGEGWLKDLNDHC